MAATVTRMLQRQGCQSAIHDDGLNAWQEISAKPNAYDLLLVDLSMPRMNGIDLVKNLRPIPFKGRIIIMRGRVSDSDLRTLKELKVDRLMPKPFTTDQFNNTVGDLLNPLPPA